MDESDEEAQTLLQCLHNINKLQMSPTFHTKTFQTIKAHTNYWALNFSCLTDLCIVDSGADSHVGGKAWLPLSPLSGPLVQTANVIGFDEASTKKTGLPIISAVTKVETQNGIMLLRAKHLIYNHSSKQTLLSTFQMRQRGIIVDDVSKEHWKAPNEKGTQSLTFPNTSIDLVLRAALFTFKVSKPTMEEYVTFPEERILDIGLENWDPHQYTDDCHQMLPVVNALQNPQETQTPPNLIPRCHHTHQVTSTPNHIDDPFELFFDPLNEEETPILGEDISDDEDLDSFYDAQEIPVSHEPKPGKVVHLTIDSQIIGHKEKGRHVCHVQSTEVSEFLNELDYHMLVGKQESFDTLSAAINTTQRLERIEQHLNIPAQVWQAQTHIEDHLKLEALQPRLAWKPLHVIKKTLENTTQWGRMLCQYPMKKHHVSRYPWNNRHRLREEVAMDTAFMATTSFSGDTCEQIYAGLVSRMINVYPMPSKAHGYILQSYQDFMRYEGVPEGLHRDMAPEEKVDKIIALNRDMKVRDTFAEPGHPNQNPAESLGVKVIKIGAEAIMNRTGAPKEAWPWVHKYIADIHNRTATPLLGWKTPISKRHNYTPDISAFIQFRFWERIYFKVDEKHPKSKEAPGYWMGVSDTVGDLITFNIWSDATKKVLQRSAVRTANPAENAIPNLRIKFEEDAQDNEEPKLVDPENKLDSPDLLVPPPRHSISHDRTRKHKVRWHDAHEPPPENLDHFKDAQQTIDDLEDDFQPHITTNDLSQSDPRRRQYIRRSCRKAHLLATSACLSLASTMGMNIIDSGQNLHHLGPPIHTVKEQHTTFEDPFLPDNPEHILETDMMESLDALPTPAFLNKLRIQYMDTFEDARAGFAYTPTEVIAHRISRTPRTVIVDNFNVHNSPTFEPTKTVTTSKHLRVKTVWQNGEVSWVNASALREQHPWTIVNYALQHNLQDHPRFQWTQAYASSQPTLDQYSRVMATQSQQGPQYKFGVQIPRNASHAFHLDELNGDHLWKEAMDKEIQSINDFKTFRVLDEGEELPEGYLKIPYHLVFDCKFDGRRKARLVAGGHKTPHVSPEEVYSGVVSMDTIRLAFVLASMNNLEVCAADISTAFLYGKTREKVYVVAGKEFGKHAGKRMIIEGGLYGLKTSAARFHEECAAKLRSMGFRPSRADYDLWIKNKGDHYEYVATYVDDILVFSRDPMKIIKEVQTKFTLKDIGKPEYYLGGNFHTVRNIDLKETDNDEKGHHLSRKWLKEDIKTAFSARTYVQQSIKKLEGMMGYEFRLEKSPMLESLHPEIDESALLDPESHSKFRSLIGCANWLVTLGRFDIAYAVNALSRFSMAPRLNHLSAIIRVFGYLKKWEKGAIMIDPKYPDHSQFNITEYEQWKEFYPDAEEMIPDARDRPTPLGPRVRITVYKDSDHAHDILTRRSVTGVLLFLNNTPVKWISKRQKTVETSTYGSELVAAKVATELIQEYRYLLRMLGTEPDGPALMLGDNNSVVLNCTMPSSVLKKKASACSYHKVRECIASGVMKFTHIPSEMNYADILTKPLGVSDFQRLVKPLLFRIPKEDQE